MPPRDPHRATVAVAVLAFVLAVVVAGCGDGSDAGDSGSDAGTAGGQADAQATQSGDEGDEAELEPGPNAPAIDRRLTRLVGAYAPVSLRANFLVAAETLRADAVDASAGEEVERERAGAVRVEIGRTRAILRAARSAVASQPVTDESQQQVQQLMLEAIDARMRATAALESALDALGTGLPDSTVEERFDAWTLAWDGSLRAAREATGVMQDARAAAGLPPAPEESIR